MDELLLGLLNQRLAGPVLDRMMYWIGQVGLAACPGIAVVLWMKGRRGDRQAGQVGAALLAALGVGLAVTLAIQYLALRPRPEGVRLVVAAPNFPSFPSGHAMAVMATATTLGLGYGRRVGAPAVGAAGLVALSRVYLGHHYPSDVAAGAVLGAGIGAAACGLMVRGEGQGVAWHWLLWPQLALVVVVTQLAYLGYLPLWLLRAPGLDKVLHFSMFGMVALWLHRWLVQRSAPPPSAGASDRGSSDQGRARGERPPLGAAATAVLVPFAAAALEEGAQAWSALRTASWTDLGCDLVGMCVGVGVSVVVERKRECGREKERGEAMSGKEGGGRDPLDL